MRLQIFFLICLLSFAFGSEKAHAGDFKVISSVELKEEYNDNIFFDDGNEEKDFITTVSPLLKLIGRNERMFSELSARFDGLVYSDNSDLNAIDHNYKGRLNYRLTPRAYVDVDAGYKKDSRRDRDIEVIDEGAATGLVQSDSTRIRSFAGFSSEITLNEITAASLSYSFSKDSFDDREDNDIRMHNVNIGFTRNLGFLDELTVGRLNFGYGRYDYLDSEVVRRLNMGIVQHVFDNTGIDSYFVTLGASRKISEVFSILADIGARHTKSEFETRYEYEPWILPLNNITQKEEDSGNGFVAQAAISYNGELTGCSLNFYRDVRPSSGRSGATERTSVRLDVNKRFTYRLRGGFFVEYYLNKAGEGEFASEGIDEKTWRVRPTIRYDFTNDIFVEAAYDFTDIRDDEDNTKRKRNQFFLKVSTKYPLFE